MGRILRARAPPAEEAGGVTWADRKNTRLNSRHLGNSYPTRPPFSPSTTPFRSCAQTDPEAFFPEKGGSTREAKRVCWSCEVRAECLQYALDNDERFGIWGGFSERERRRLKRQAA